MFEIDARDGVARAGVLHCGHGDVHTPVFVPLASTATVKTLHASEVAELGFEMVLGNTFHLLMQPGPDYVRELGGLHDFMGWRGAIVTDSGGYQVFSMGHGSVAEEIKRRRPPGESRVLSIDEEGVRFRSYVDGSERFMGPEESMAVQAQLSSDIALAFDECTPYHADRDYTARSTERTHRWLRRCLEWHDREGSRGQAVFGIVQGGVYEDLREASAGFVSEAAVDGIAIGGTLGRDKEEMRGVVGMTVAHLPDDPPRHLLGIGEPDDLVHGIGMGIDLFDCAVPTRLARHGMALAPRPDDRYRYDIRKSEFAQDERPLVEGCPCPTCAAHTRAYVHYLSRAEELTGVRLLVMHNLAYLARLVSGAREAIEAGRYGAYRDATLAGRGPWDAAPG